MSQPTAATPHHRGAIVAGVALLVATVCGAGLLLRRDRDAASPAALARAIDSELEYTLDSLPNGVRYYVRAHPSSGDRTELRLVVDAGSVQETDDQRGLAHAVEHMVFRGTRSFPDGAVERWFESIGMRRGSDVNAVTSFDDTQYRMTVPTTRAGAIDTALAMLASMAHEATFDPDDARREAGVLFEEWRSSRDADARVADARRPLVFEGTPYASRIVIGDTGVLARFDRAAMRRYYESWYRPELLAVIAVGDFDADSVQSMVRRHFGRLPSRGGRIGRPAPPAPRVPPARPRVTVVPDGEARSSWIGVWHAGPRQRYRTRGDYRQGLVGSLWRAALQARLDDASRLAGSPFASADVDLRALARRIAADVVTVTAMKGRTMPALEATAAELKALARHGPTAGELEEHAGAMQRVLDEEAQSGDSNSELADEFIDHFLTGNAVLTRRAADEMTRALLPTITADDVKAYARARATDSGSVLVVATTEDDTVARVTAEAIAARVSAAPARTLVPADTATDVRELLDIAPTPGRIVTEHPVPEVSAYEWTLSNGMRVLLKPTSFNFDEIQFRAVAPGGASLAPDDAYASAWLADVIIGQTGVGKVPAPRLRRWLDGTSISLAPTVTNDAVFLEGETTSDDLEAFFRLVHLYLTAPRRDTVAFLRFRERMASLQEDRGRDPDAVFSDSVAALMSGGHPRALRYGAPFYLRARHDEALEFWTRRGANASNFTVAITGDFTLASVRPLIERYLAPIPRGVQERPRDLGVPVPTGAATREVPGGVEQRARTTIGFTGPFERTNESVQALKAVSEIVERAVTDRLRERMGGTYSVDVSFDIDVVPPARYTMTLGFESMPSRIDALAAAAIDELSRLHREGPTDAQFAGVREALIRDFDGNLEDNAYWASELTFHARHGWPLAGIAEHGREAAAMTREGMQRACATYIPADGYRRVTMRPRLGRPRLAASRPSATR